MSKTQKVFAIIIWSAAVISMVGVLALKTRPDTRANSSNEPIATVHNDDPVIPVLYNAPIFALTNENGKTVTNTDMLGKVWIADFIFTSCTTICPQMSADMHQLQKDLPESIKFVSFSVDPVNDTPPVMLKYLQSKHYEPGRWTMLTGDLKTQSAVINGMKLNFEPATKTDSIQHDTHFVLVDQKGQIRGYYDTIGVDGMQKVEHDAKLLLAEATTQP